MKLRTSFFNKTAFRKNLTRFAPAWGLYTLCLLLGLMILADTDMQYYQVSNMADCIQYMPVVNICYALLCAMLLFGDLYNSRMCNALHALPMRRESWFLTNITSGLLFSLVPSLVMTLFAIPLCAMSVVTDGWLVPLYWLLGNNLQFLAFFGIAVFSALCVGSRFAMAVVYGILNFASLLAYWLVDTLYTPMLYGVRTNETPFVSLSPVVRMVGTPYIETEAIWAEDSVSIWIDRAYFTLTDGWGVLLLWAAVGVALMGIAMLLYRRRNLECAGDFIAVKPLEPVFLGIYTIAMGVAFQFCQNLFLGGSGVFWLYIGLVVGFFTGLMLLKRTPRVFRKKTFAVCGGIMLAVAASLLIPVVDLFGIEGWMPEKDEIKSVTVCSGHSLSYRYNNAVTLKNEEDINKVLRLHQLALDSKAQFESWDIGTGFYTVSGIYYSEFYSEERSIDDFTICYELEDGRTVCRYYYGYVQSEVGEILNPWFSDIQVVLGITEDEIPTYADALDDIYLDGISTQDEMTQEQRQSLLEAIAADCAEGTMVQDWAYHEEVQGRYESCCLDFQFWDSKNGYHDWRSVQVYADSVHTMQWLLDNGMQSYMDIYNQDYE